MTPLVYVHISKEVYVSSAIESRESRARRGAEPSFLRGATPFFTSATCEKKKKGKKTANQKKKVGIKIFVGRKCKYNSNFLKFVR